MFDFFRNKVKILTMVLFFGKQTTIRHLRKNFEKDYLVVNPNNKYLE